MSGNRPGSHKGVFSEPGGKPPLPGGKIVCQQPSERAEPDDGQLWIVGKDCGAEARGWPVQPAARDAISTTTAVQTRRARIQLRY